MNKDFINLFNEGEFSDTTLSYNGYIYWIGKLDEEDSSIKVVVTRWKRTADIKKLVDFSKLAEFISHDFNEIKQKFATSLLFDKKRYSDVEQDMELIDLK